jgi:hypothetical protein
MKNQKTILSLIAFVVVASVTVNAAFTDVNQKAYWGKTNIKPLTAAIDANFASIEAGTGGGATALSVTNGQPITVSAGVYIVSGIGQANDSTNTVTLVAPTAAGQKVTIIMATATTNLVTIADSTTVAASGAILLDANDTAVLQAVDTSTWCLISESNN